MATTRTQEGYWQLKTGHGVYVRWMIRRDMPEVMAIEQDGQPCPPWTEEDFLQARAARNCIGMVAELETKGKPIVGHIVYEIQKARLYILNLCVHHRCRRVGIGSAMLSRLKGKLLANRRDRIVIDARESFLGNHLFLKANGFEAVSIKRDFFQDDVNDLDTVRVEDAYRFVYRVK